MHFQVSPDYAFNLRLVDLMALLTEDIMDLHEVTLQLHLGEILIILLGRVITVAFVSVDPTILLGENHRRSLRLPYLEFAHTKNVDIAVYAEIRL